MRKRVLRILVSLVIVIGLLAYAVPAFAATTGTMTITATPEYLAITVSDGGTNTWAIGEVAESTTKWYTADNNAPSPEPFEEADMKIALTNTGSITSNIKIHGHAFTGGVGWTLSADDTPGTDEVSIRAGITGTTNEAAMVQVGTSDAELVHALAASGHKDSCLELETGTFSDGDAKTSTLTYTVEKHV